MSIVVEIECQAEGNRWPPELLGLVVLPKPVPTDAERLERTERKTDDILGVFREVVKIAPKRKPPKPRTPVVGF